MGAAESTLRKPSLDDFDALNLYEVLGVSEEAKEDEIKRAYRQRALETHPDKNRNDIDGATRRFARVQEAYETLSDPTSRTTYDFKKDNPTPKPQPQPGQWKPQASNAPPPSSNTTSGGGWFDWFFSTWGWGTGTPTATDPLLRYIPEEYVKSSTFFGNGISAQDVVEYINVCGEKAGWVENGRDQSLFTLTRNLFECLAHDERKYGANSDQIPDFGCGHSAWSPEDNPRAHHYAEDFYTYWLNFKTCKTFDWVRPYRTLDPEMFQKVAKENRKIQNAVREEYDEVVRTVVDGLLRCDPRFTAHLYYRFYRTGQLPSGNFYNKFVQRCKARASTRNQPAPARAETRREPQEAHQTTNMNEPQGRNQTRNQRKKQKKRNKAKQKKSW